MLQFHADKVSAPISYFGCCCYWIFSCHHVLCHCQLFLFRLRSLLFQIFFLSFSWSILVFIERNSIFFVLCFCPFRRVDFVFFVSSVLYFLSRGFRELLLSFFVCVELATTWFSLVALSYPIPLKPTNRSYVVYGFNISTTYPY